MVDADADRELQYRRQVLQKARQSRGESAGSGGEEQKWNGGHDAGCGEERGVASAVVREDQRALRLQHK